jgi:Ribosomal RNA methyltransferase (FmrO)
MTERDHRAAQVVARLAAELAEVVAKRYRIEVEAAQGLVMDAWAAEAPLWQQAARDDDPKRLVRTRAYKQAAERAKTKIYYHLRRYRQDEPGLADATERLLELATAGVGSDDPRAQAAREAVVVGHVSTRERLPDLDAFWTALFALAPAPTSILDLGCGVHPLLYPFSGTGPSSGTGPFHGAGRATSSYLGLDRDAVAVELVNAWAGLVGGGRLHARRWSLTEGFAGIEGPEPDGRFAIALALKLVPVVSRQERELLPLLAEVPAQRLLVTGARQAMVKRHSIEQRELRVLRAFADDHGFAVVGALETDTEIGLLLERG